MAWQRWWVSNAAELANQPFELSMPFGTRGPLATVVNEFFLSFATMPTQLLQQTLAGTCLFVLSLKENI